MEIKNPIEFVNHLRTWVDNKLSSANSPEVMKTKSEYDEIQKMIEFSELKNFPVSQELIVERERLKKILSRPDSEENMLRELSDELLSLSHYIKKGLNNKKTSQPSPGDKAPPTTLKVMFSDGTIIYENNAIDSFLKTLERLGLDKVEQLTSIKCHGYPIVSRNRNPNAHSLKELEGYFIETHSSTKTKEEYLRKISKQLAIDIKIEIVDKF